VRQRRDLQRRVGGFVNLAQARETGCVKRSVSRTSYR
jgi:hypothetical protein